MWYNVKMSFEFFFYRNAKKKNIYILYVFVVGFFVEEC
jgi:hypothetical protein